jgi:hypothetical protein
MKNRNGYDLLHISGTTAMNPLSMPKCQRNCSKVKNHLVVRYIFHFLTLIFGKRHTVYTCKYGNIPKFYVEQRYVMQ